MTPQEKAKELVEKFEYAINHTVESSYMYSMLENVDIGAKEIAKIAVDEILHTLSLTNGVGFMSEYYQQVKEEIMKA